MSVSAVSRSTSAASSIAGPAPSGEAIWTPLEEMRSPSGVTARRSGCREIMAHAVVQPSIRRTSPKRWLARPGSTLGPSRSTSASTPALAATVLAGAISALGAATTGTPPPPEAFTVSTACCIDSDPSKATASAHRPSAASTAASRPGGTSSSEIRLPLDPSAPSTERRASRSKRPARAAPIASTRALAAATASRASMRSSSALAHFSWSPERRRVVWSKTAWSLTTFSSIARTSSLRFEISLDSSRSCPSTTSSRCEMASNSRSSRRPAASRMLNSPRTAATAPSADRAFWVVITLSSSSNRRNLVSRESASLLASMAAVSNPSISPRIAASSASRSALRSAVA